MPGNHPVTVHSTENGKLSVFIKAFKAILPVLSTFHFVADSPMSQYRNRTIRVIVAKNVCTVWPLHLRGPSWRLATGKVHATVKERADRIITHSRKFCQAVRSSETTTTVIYSLGFHRNNNHTRNMHKNNVTYSGTYTKDAKAR